MRTDPKRLHWLDQARGAALLAMTAYHLSWDLFSLGVSSINPVTTQTLTWSAKIIAAVFLALSGFSLVTAHAQTIQWRKIRPRLLKLAGAAALVSLGSFLLFPASWIAFGILHHMALASLLGLLFVRWSALPLAGLALAVLILPDFARNDFFNAPLFLFLGLARIVAPANDYVPLLPWFGFFLAGMAWAKTIALHPPALAQADPSRPLRLMGFLGQHSLLYYLIHQPVLLGLLNLLLALGLLSPVQNQRVEFTAACERDCSFDLGDEQICRRMCGCIYNDLQTAPDVLTTPPALMSPKQEGRLRQAIKQCR